MNGPFSKLLLDAPQGRHFCQLHHSSDSLDAAVILFVETGLHLDEAVIVVAFDSRIARVRDHIGHAGFDCAALERSKQLTLLNSDDVLARFMSGDKPVWSEFREKVGRVVEAVNVSSGKNLRVFGEMVNDLWRARNANAAIRLEEYWNSLAKEYSFCLFCGYELNGLDADSYTGPLDEIARTHTDIPATPDDSRYLAALEAASVDILGMSLASMLSMSGATTPNREHRLPIVYRTVLWLQRHMPSAMTKVLGRARYHYDVSLRESHRLGSGQASSGPIRP